MGGGGDNRPHEDSGSQLLRGSLTPKTQEGSEMEHYWKDGWYFQGLNTGGVRIFHIEPGDNPQIADQDIEIDAESWGEIVLAMTP